ncbi:MAG TPA: hypothetical protein VK826_05700, partial [Bacteroidia bacterium]|nr:hypothetical protein [Bacteroidia bacterium]
SAYVEGDTIVGANTYKKIRTVQGSGSQFFLPVYPLELVRDSAGYIVDVNGEFIEHTNFTDTLKYFDFGPGMCDGWYFMRHKDSSVTVPAGTFLTIDYECHMHSIFPNPNLPALRYTHEVFANGIGKIVQTTFYSNSASYYQRRLLRYHIQ